MRRIKISLEGYATSSAKNLFSKTFSAKPLPQSLFRKTSSAKPLPQNLFRKTSSAKDRFRKNRFPQNEAGVETADTETHPSVSYSFIVYRQFPSELTHRCVLIGRACSRVLRHGLDIVVCS